MGPRGQRALRYVVDASVVAAWFIPGEAWGTTARRLRDSHARGTAQLGAPEMLPYELCNSLWKAVARGLMAKDTALAFARAFSKISPRLFRLDSAMRERALRISVDSDITFYDSAYIVVAQDTSSTLVSADTDLLAAARRHVDVLSVEELEDQPP